jgi:neutral ceramidase
VDWLTARLVDVIGAALADVQPARLTVRQTTASFARNRRGADVVDHSVPVLEVAPDGRRRAVVFSYACHNLVMPPDDGRYCADYAGFAAADLEADGVALFVAGAGADQDPEPRGTEALTREHGRSLAAAIRDCLGTPGVAISGPLRVAYDEVPLEFQPLPPRDRLEADRTSPDLPTRTKAAHLLACLDRGESFPASYPCPLHVARFGDALLLVAIGGEPVIDYAHELKRRYAGPGRVVWVAGYANDMFGYVPTAGVLAGGGYEGTRSVLWSALPAPFAESTDQRVLDGVDRLVRRVGWA